MARGDSYVSERALFRDPRSGLRIVRLTHGPAISTNLYFEMCSFTQDERHVLFMSQRYGGRGAPYDLFRAQTDGMELVQLTDCDDISGVCFCPETNRVLYQTGREIRSLDALTLEEHTAGRVSGPRLDPQYSLASVDKHGASYYGMYAKPEGGSALFRLDVATGAVVVLHEAARHNRINVNPLDRQVYFNVFEDGVFSPRIMSTDGTRLRPFPFQRFAHHTWLGETGAWQGCLLNPDSGVVTFEEGAEGPTDLPPFCGPVYELGVRGWSLIIVAGSFGLWYRCNCLPGV